jgi:hypothetical protein
VAAEDGVAAVDVRGDILEPRSRQGITERVDGELGGTADATEQQDEGGLCFGFRHEEVFYGGGGAFACDSLRSPPSHPFLFQSSPGGERYERP